MRKVLPGHNKLVRRMGFCVCAFVLVVLLNAPRVYRELFLDEPLWGAVQQGKAGEVKRLLAAGASPDATWEDGTTALKVAQRSRDIEIIRILKEAGATE